MVKYVVLINRLTYPFEKYHSAYEQMVEPYLDVRPHGCALKTHITSTLTYAMLVAMRHCYNMQRAAVDLSHTITVISPTETIFDLRKVEKLNVVASIDGFYTVEETGGRLVRIINITFPGTVYVDDVHMEEIHTDIAAWMQAIAIHSTSPWTQGQQFLCCRHGQLANELQKRLDSPVSGDMLRRQRLQHAATMDTYALAATSVPPRKAEIAENLCTLEQQQQLPGPPPVTDVEVYTLKYIIYDAVI